LRCFLGVVVAIAQDHAVVVALTVILDAPASSAKYGLRLLATSRPMVAVVLALSERATALGT
jgi:hypothetical protein